MPAAAAALVHRYYTYAGIYTLAASIIWGINTLFLLDAGLSVAEVFFANAAFSVGTVLFEIPTGVVADTVGRRASFLLSVLVLAASTLAYVALAAMGGGVVAFSVVSVFLGLGYTFYSGAMEAWLVDGVRGLGYDGAMDRVFANGQMIGGAAMLVGTIGGGLLGQIDLAIPFVVRSLLLVLLFVLAYFGMHDIGFQSKPVTWRTLPAEANAVAATGVRFGWQNRPLRLIMIAGAIQGGVFMWAWYAWQPYFLELLASRRGMGRRGGRRAPGRGDDHRKQPRSVHHPILRPENDAPSLDRCRILPHVDRRRLGDEFPDRSCLPARRLGRDGCPDAGPSGASFTAWSHHLNEQPWSRSIR